MFYLEKKIKIAGLKKKTAVLDLQSEKKCNQCGVKIHLAQNHKGHMVMVTPGPTGEYWNKHKYNCVPVN